MLTKRHPKRFRWLPVASYNCAKCPGYCCSYPVIPLKKRDVQRLADHFSLTFEVARKKFTKTEGEEPFAMRRKADKHFGKICRFFDTDKRWVAGPSYPTAGSSTQSTTSSSPTPTTSGVTTGPKRPSSLLPVSTFC